MLDYLRYLKRRFYQLRYGLHNVDKTFIACKNCSISKDFVAGTYSYVGPGCSIYPKVKIGKYTMLANDVHILGGDHRFDNPKIPIIFSGRSEMRETIIGDDVWVGAYTIIMAGVRIGNGAVIAAGSVISKDVEPYTIVGGQNRIIRKRFKNEEDIIEHELMLQKNPMSLPKTKRQVLRGNKKSM